jgi:hypothetical protein
MSQCNTVSYADINIKEDKLSNKISNDIKGQ